MDFICLFNLFTNIIYIRYNFTFIYCKKIRYNNLISEKTKKLALGCYIISILWFLYYEIDLIVIGYVLGAKEVAIFFFSINLSKFLRKFSSIIILPF